MSELDLSRLNLNESSGSSFYNTPSQTPTDNKPHTKDPLPTLQDDGFKRLPALVKGYLTRRLMKTEYVQELKRTIADTMIELEAFRTDDVLSPQDVLLHEQLMIQFNKSYMEFYNVFFKYSKPTQMQLIARSRELRRERVFSRASSRFSVNGNSTMSILQANSSVVKANKAKRRLTVTVASVPPKTESIPEPKRITRRMTDKAAAFIENKSPRPVRRLTRERPTTRKTALKATQVR
ncbi:Centriolar coiled-coil protein [Halotydeus destructor]|nr:Centriolar coiled-coil protein [Halotydeus destructor]